MTPTSHAAYNQQDMAPNNQQQQAAAAVAAAAAAVRLPEFHADSPQCWFDNLDSQFARANITQSITKFHWAVAKLPFSLNPTIPPNRAGNRFPLARSLGFLHALPPFSTTSPLGPLAAAECRQD